MDDSSRKPLEPSEMTRYSRHLILPEVGLAGQTKIKQARVLIVGAGGLGSPCAVYLAAAGVGKLGLVDFDRIELSNLQRQVLYATDEVGQSKVHTAATRLQRLNDRIDIIAHDERFSKDNALELIKQYDFIIDGTDNFATRYLVNDACIIAEKPNIYGSIYRFEGQVSVFAPQSGGPCYRCLFPQAPPPDAVPNCAEGGVLGVLAGTIGVLQATETLKLITGIGTPLIGKLLLYDALDMRFDTLRINRNPDCSFCSETNRVDSLTELDGYCSSSTTGDAFNNSVTDREGYIEALELDSLLKRGANQLTLLDVRTPEEVALGKIPGAVAIPLAELAARADELDPQRELIVYCKSGVRSAKALELLNSKGFRHIRQLRGGILKWHQDVDPAMIIY